MSASGSVTVRELLPVLGQWHARLLAGERGLSRSVTWATTMRARLPAFETFQGGELALLSLATLRTLRSQLVAFSLPAMVDQLAAMGASAIAVAGAEGDALSPQDAESVGEAQTRADEHGIPLLALPAGAALDKVKDAVLSHVTARRDRLPLARGPADPTAARLRASLRGEALDALLSGTYAGEPQMRSRAAQLGYDLSHPYIALWIELDVHTVTGAAVPLAAAEPTPLAAELAETLAISLGAWTRARAAQVVALAPQGKPERGAPDLADQAQGLVARVLGTSSDEGSWMSRNGGHLARVHQDSCSWAAGVGEPAIGPAHLRRSATEAHDAARLGFLVLGAGQVARIADLGVYQLLLALRESGHLEAFVRRTLAPFDRDPKDREQHLETLDALFECRGNVTQAAKELHLHRNSLLYRLGIIRRLLERDLDDPDQRLALQLALKGRKVIEL